MSTSPKWLIWYLSATEYLLVDVYVGPWWLIILQDTHFLGIKAGPSQQPTLETRSRAVWFWYLSIQICYGAITITETGGGSCLKNAWLKRFREVYLSNVKTTFIAHCQHAFGDGVSTLAHALVERWYHSIRNGASREGDPASLWWYPFSAKVFMIMIKQKWFVTLTRRWTSCRRKMERAIVFLCNR